MNDTIIVFDLDGTLVDTAPDLIHAANHVLVEKGLSPVAGDVLRPAISFGGRRILEVGLAANDAPATPDDLEDLFERFLVHYAANIAYESRPFPGLVDVLDELGAQGALFAVCTNKREDLSRLLLDALGLMPRFAFLAGRDTFPVYKPDPGHLTGTIARAGGSDRRAIMVGDSATDVNTARAAGIPIVGVSFGYTETPMHELGPDVVIDSYRDFPRAVATILARR